MPNGPVRAPTVTESLSRLKHYCSGGANGSTDRAPTVTESLSRLKLGRVAHAGNLRLAPTVTESLSRLKHDDLLPYGDVCIGSNSDGIAFAIETCNSQTARQGPASSNSDGIAFAIETSGMATTLPASAGSNSDGIAFAIETPQLCPIAAIVRALQQ